MTRQSPEKNENFDEPSGAQGFFERVAVWLQANDLVYADYPDSHYFSLRYTGDAGEWRVIIDVGDGGHGPQLLIYSYYPIRIPESRRPAVAELLSRINIEIWLGCFAMDWKDGEVSIRTSMPVADGEFTDQQLERLFYANLGLADRHLSGVCAVAFGNVPPALAIELAEVPPKEGLQ